MMTAPHDLSWFDPEFASATEWARMYRQLGLQVVPGSKNAKVPGLPGWIEFQDELVSQERWDKWFLRPAHWNMGIITGRASGNLVAIDLDEHKNPAATAWWEEIKNERRCPPTVEQRTGGGGRHILFRAHAGWTPPQGANAELGVDIRGQGGWIVAPPSQFEGGNQYKWIEGHEPWKVPIPDAPLWVMNAIDRVVKSSGNRVQINGDLAGGLNPSNSDHFRPPAEGLYDSFGNLTDSRESYMTRMVWAAVLNLYRECGGDQIFDSLQECKKAYDVYAAHVNTRIPGEDREEGIEREGRGLSAFQEKWDRAMRLWDTKVAEEAAKPRPFGPNESENDSYLDRDKTERVRAEERKEEAAGIHARPFPWTDPKDIRPRRWVYGRHYIREFLSTTVAPGGVGKSSLEIVELLAIATGRPLLGVAPDERCAVWYWNGEDPMDELLRRIMAAAIHHGVTEAELKDRFFVNTGRSTPIIVAEKTRDGVIINAPVVDQVIATIRANKIGVMSIDPFVACHRVTENDNSEIERVAKTWAHIADVMGCAIELVHHVRKTNGGEVTVEDGRGAVALLSAARAARAINRMTQDEAARVAIPDPQFYFRLDNGKANLAPPSAVKWFHLVSIDLGNERPLLGEEPARPSDKVGVVTQWEWPDFMGDVTGSDYAEVRRLMLASNVRWRADPQATDWVGKVICLALNLPADDKASQAKARAIQADWIKNGSLREVQGLDAARRKKTFIELGD